MQAGDMSISSMSISDGVRYDEGSASDMSITSAGISHPDYSLRRGGIPPVSRDTLDLDSKPRSTTGSRHGTPRARALASPRLQRSPSLENMAGNETEGPVPITKLDIESRLLGRSLQSFAGLPNFLHASGRALDQDGALSSHVPTTSGFDETEVTMTEESMDTDE